MKANLEEHFQIGEVAKRLGITTRTIRYYEEIGLVGPSNRLGTGFRMYVKEDITRLKFILKLKELGISLKQMRELAENYHLHMQDHKKIMPKLLKILDQHIQKVDNKIFNLSSLRKDIVDYRFKIVKILQGQVPISSQIET